MKTKPFFSMPVLFLTMTMPFLFLSCLREMPTPVFYETYLKYEMVIVPGGSFVLGGVVNLSSFAMSRTEITQDIWTGIMGYNKSYYVGDNLPVEQVSWFEAVEFCNKKSIAEGKVPCYTIAGDYNLHWELGSVEMKRTGGYRLPTEAEWQYAAGGGAEQLIYAGTNDVALVSNYAWYVKNSGGATWGVGGKLPNSLGLYDMGGNVSEWCWDRTSGTGYPSEERTNPTGDSTGVYRIYRGSCYGNDINSCRNDLRILYFPSLIARTIGFRIVRDL